jgi:hypothetical protein
MKDSSGRVGPRGRYCHSKRVVRTPEVFMRLSIDNLEVLVNRVADDDIVRRHGTFSVYRNASADLFGSLQIAGT